MARAKGAQPKGEREQRLLDLVEDSGYESVAAFTRAVAKRTKNTNETEKSAFYRIIRGDPGDRVLWRLRHYAKVLGIDEAELVGPWKEDRSVARPTDADLQRLTRIVQLLEEDPTAAGGELVPLMQRLADEFHARSDEIRQHSEDLRELSFRLRQAVARASERWRSG